MKNSEYISYFSPAKLNLFFKVLFKRKDDYHEILSHYQAVDLCDILNIKTSKKDVFRCSDKSLETKDNLVLKALFLFRKRAGIVEKFDIFLDKKIPVEAGLGGGSSNAASCLFAINELTKKLPQEELIEISKSIGSDLSFFFSSGSAICRGRGDLFEDTIFKKQNFFIAKPKFGLSTKKVYENLNIKKTFENRKGFFNDLEESAFLLEPRMKKIKDDLLNSGFEKVCMTGSGSAFFAYGEGKKIDGLDFYSVKTIKKEKNSWFKL